MHITTALYSSNAYRWNISINQEAKRNWLDRGRPFEDSTVGAHDISSPSWCIFTFTIHKNGISIQRIGIGQVNHSMFSGWETRSSHDDIPVQGHGQHSETRVIDVLANQIDSAG